MATNLDGNFKKLRIQPEMNVTPLVDVVLVLLIIFMVLAPVVSKSFWVRLPPKDDKEEQLDATNDPNKPLVLTIDAEGKTLINKIEVDRGELTPQAHPHVQRSPRQHPLPRRRRRRRVRPRAVRRRPRQRAQAWPIVFLTTRWTDGHTNAHGSRTEAAPL
jgi:biopolymer transport protein ExbD